MKRTFLAKRNALLSSTDISWDVAALACVIIILLVRIIAPYFFWYVFTPVFRVSDALTEKSQSFINSFGDTAALASKNEQLANENAALAVENKTLSKKLSDISSLSISPMSSIGILAGVVASPPESPYDTLVVDAGKDKGVTLGMEAFGAGGVPVGVVSSVLDDFSRITLISAPGTDTVGWVGQSNLSLTIFGVGGGAMNATVARSANIVEGDTVFVPGPGMLPVGTVTRVDKDPSSPSVTLRIQPALNLFSIPWVLLRDTGAALTISATSTTI